MSDIESDKADLAAYEESEPDFLEGSKFFPSPNMEFLRSRQKQNQEIAIIRTSDRTTYRRCRRKWNWSQASRGNRRSKSESGPFWLGTGMHFAFEDYHGYHRFDSMVDSLKAYASATQKTQLDLPSDLDELLQLGCGMLDYYESWLATREPLQTLWIDGVPQVEVPVIIEIPKEDLLRAGCPERVLSLYSHIYYSATLDRVTIDSYSRLWLCEYKSAKNYQWFHLDTDQQVTSYSWTLTIKYPNYAIAGCCYQQHKKRAPKSPDWVASRKMFSTSKSQKTTYALYKTALINAFGPTQLRWPEPNRLFLDYLTQNEALEGDFLIKRDYVERNEHQIRNEYRKMLLEISEMLDPETRIYPNPTRDCRWDCTFQVPCIHIDDGSDWKYELDSNFIERTAEEVQWRKYIIYPHLNFTDEMLKVTQQTGRQT